MKRLTFALIAAAFATTAHAGEIATTVGAVKGDVLVSNARGLAAAKAGATLKVGDRVVARTGAVEVRYADGCKATVQAGGMTTISAQSPCAGGPGIVTAGGSSAQLGLPKWPAGAYVAGAGVVVIVGAVLYGLSDPISD